MNTAKKYRDTIDKAIVALLSRAENRRGLKAENLFERVVKSLDKYLFRDEPNAGHIEIKEFIDGCRADDLCLIIACENGNETAWEDLVKNFDFTVKSAARKICRNNDDAEDLASSIWAELYGLRVDKHGERKTKLAYYSGRGSLGGWLRAVTGQLAIDEFRKMKRFVQVEEDRAFENMAQSSSERTEFQTVVSATENPEEIFSETEAQKDVAKAMKQAMDELKDEDKLILKLYYFDDLKLKDIGKTFGFHEATASRKVARMQTDIRKSVEKILCREHDWNADEVGRHLSETAAKLGINLEKMFTILTILTLVQDFFGAGVQ